MEIFKVIAEFGVATFATFGLIYTSISLIILIKNHIGSATKANQRLADMIEQMLRFLEGKR